MRVAGDIKGTNTKVKNNLTTLWQKKRKRLKYKRQTTNNNMHNTAVKLITEDRANLSSQQI